MAPVLSPSPGRADVGGARGDTNVYTQSDTHSDERFKDKSNGASSGNSDALDLDSIAPVLNAGFRAVLEEASKRGVLDPPHGRTLMPDPKKLIEDDPYGSGDDGDDEDDIIRRQVEDEGGTGGEGGTSEAQGEAERVVDGETTTCCTSGTRENGHLPAVAGDGSRDERVPDSNEGGNGRDGDYDEDDDDHLLDYEFHYGFNPLVFLGDYLRKNSPAAVCAREKKRDDDLKYLLHRAAKGLERETAIAELCNIVGHRRSGIASGPVVGEVSECGGIFWAKAFSPGQVMVELSRHEDFHAIYRQAEMKVDHSTDCSALVEFDDLEPRTVWHHRTYLYNPRKGFDGPSAGFGLIGTFVTLPERGDDNGGSFRLAAFSLHGLGRKSETNGHGVQVKEACAAISATKPSLCLALGEPSTQQGTEANTSVRRASGDFTYLHAKASKVPMLSQLLRHHSFLTAVGHLTVTAKRRHRDKQQKAHKRNKRWSSRGGEGSPPGSPNGSGISGTAGTPKNTLSRQSSERGPSDGSGGTRSDKDGVLPSPEWPMRYSESWDSRTLGPHAEIFMIDARNGILGEDQLSWVVEAVEESSRTWKIIACGVPVGFPTTPSHILVREDKSPAEEDLARRHAAAAKIQSTMRARLASTKAPATASDATSTATTTATATKKPAITIDPAPAVQQQRAAASLSSPGKEESLRPLTSAEGRADRINSAPPGQRDCGSVDNKGSRATQQMQDLISQLHAGGCRNVVIMTPARSRPHALSFFSGSEAQGRYPVHELGCSGLMPVQQHRRSTHGVSEPFVGLSPKILLREFESVAFTNHGDRNQDHDIGVGLACTVTFGQGRDGGGNRDEDGVGEDAADAHVGAEFGGGHGTDALCFDVFNSGGDKVASLTLPAMG